MQGADGADFWTYLDLRIVTFKDIGLDPSERDKSIWQFCQEKQLYLVTNNRNDDGPDSLEATIKSFNPPASLPVFTIGDADRVLVEREYADRVTDRLFRYLLEAENIRGTGRLFLP